MIIVIVMAIAAIGLIIGSRLIGPHNRLPGRGGEALPIHSLGNRPVLQIELARNENDLRRVLAVGDVPRNIADARAGNNLDSLLFIPSYAAFLISLGFFLSRQAADLSDVALALALAAVPLAAYFDWLENRGIAIALKHLETQQDFRYGDARHISVPSFLKWCLLALTLIGFGATAVSVPRLWMLFLGIVLIGLGLLTAATLARYLAERP